MNYYISYDNFFYNVVDGNTCQVIASFVSEQEANKFIQSLFGFSYNSLNSQNVMMPITHYINPQNINLNNNCSTNTIPVFVNASNQLSPTNTFHQQPMFNYQQSPEPLPVYNNNQQSLNQNLQHNENVEQQINQPKLNIEECFEEQKTNKENFEIKTNQEPEKRIDFNDNNLSIDVSLFEDDKLGAIIQQQKRFINNTDDDSLGEASAYKEMKPLRKEVEIDDNKNEQVSMSVEDPDNKNITKIYEENLIPDSSIVTKHDDDIIDLGPITEEDDIFSTPRKDAEQEDFETFPLSKKERAELKKAKKKEERSRKKYQKLMK